MGQGNCYAATCNVISYSLDIEFIHIIHGRSCKNSGFLFQCIVNTFNDNKFHEGFLYIQNGTETLQTKGYILLENDIWNTESLRVAEIEHG